MISSCEKDPEDLLTFDVNKEVEITLPGFPGVVDTTFTVNSPNIPFSLDDIAAKNKTKSDLIKDIKLSKISLTAMDPSSQDLGFLKTLTLLIVDNAANSEIMATRNDFPQNMGTSADLTATNAVIDAFLRKGDFKIAFTAGADDELPQSTKIKIDMVFTMTADPL